MTFFSAICLRWLTWIALNAKCIILYTHYLWSFFFIIIIAVLIENSYSKWNARKETQRMNRKRDEEEDDETEEAEQEKRKNRLHTYTKIISWLWHNVKAKFNFIFFSHLLWFKRKEHVRKLKWLRLCDCISISYIWLNNCSVMTSLFFLLFISHLFYLTSFFFLPFYLKKVNINKKKWNKLSLHLNIILRITFGSDLANITHEWLSQQSPQVKILLEY